MVGREPRLGDVCLDASVIVKLLTRESDSQKAADLFGRLIEEKAKIFEPNFLKIEVYSTLRKKAYLKELSIKKVRDSLKYFQELSCQYRDEEKSLLDQTLKLSEKLTMPVIYDCLYLALAKKEKAVFISADKKFISKAKKVYQKSFSLAEVNSSIGF